MTMVGLDLLAVGSEYNIHIYNIKYDKLDRQLKGHSGLLRDLNLLDDYNTLVSSSDDKTIRLWNLTTGKCTKILTGHTFSANRTILYRNNILVSVSDDSTIKFWDLEKGSQVTSIEGHNSWVIYSTIMEDGTLVTAGADKHVRFWSESKV